MSEIRMRQSCCNDQIIEFDLAVGQRHSLGCSVDRDGLAEQHAGVFLRTQNVSDRRRDLRGRQSGRGHLIKQRLKRVVIGAIDD